MTRKEEIEHIAKRLEKFDTAETNEEVKKHAPLLLECEHMLRVLERCLESVFKEVEEDIKKGIYNNVEYDKETYRNAKEYILALKFNQHNFNVSMHNLKKENEKYWENYSLNKKY